MRLILDTMIVSAIVTPKRQEHRVIREWASRLLDSPLDVPVFHSELVDFEVRRGLIHLALKNSNDHVKAVRTLDLLQNRLDYLPLTTAVMRRSAHLWAEARTRGRPTAPPDRLDGDVILGAQAESVDAIVVTENSRHFVGVVKSTRWSEVIP